MQEPISIIFICTGNICRSPMAEGILQHRWSNMEAFDIVVTSMGIHGLDNKPASQFSQDVCREHSIDISTHRSRGLVVSEMDTAHLIFCMEKVQKEFIQLFVPKFYEKTFLLGAWPDQENRKSAINDPMGRPIKQYRRTYVTIANHIDRIIPVILDNFSN